MTRTLLVILMITLSQTAFAESSIYQWRDASGQIQFGDRPPHPEQAESVSTAQMRAINSQAPPPDMPSMLSRQTSKAPSRKRQRSSRCDSYRRGLAMVEDKLRAGYREPQGNRLRERRRELSGKLWRECG